MNTEIQIPLREFTARLDSVPTAVGAVPPLRIELTGDADDLWNLENSQAWPLLQNQRRRAPVAVKPDIRYITDPDDDRGPDPAIVPGIDERVVDAAEHQRVVAVRLTTLGGHHLATADVAVASDLVERLKGLIGKLGTHGVRRLSFSPAICTADHPQAVTYQHALNRTAALLRELLSAAETAGVILAVSVSDAGFLTSPPEAREMLNSLNSSAVGADIALTGRSDALAAGDWLGALGALVWSVVGEAWEADDKLATQVEACAASYVMSSAGQRTSTTAATRA